MYYVTLDSRELGHQPAQAPHAGTSPPPAPPSDASWPPARRGGNDEDRRPRDHPLRDGTTAPPMPTPAQGAGTSVTELALTRCLPRMSRDRP